MSALKPGDLAFIIHCHCVAQERVLLGDIVRIESIPLGLDEAACGICKGEVRLAHAVITRGPRRGLLPLTWMRKIEPLSDREKHDTELQYDVDHEIADPIHRIVPAKA